MPTKKPSPKEILDRALALYHAGLDPEKIELPEVAIFPHLIPVQPATARKARTTGSLLGRPGPKYVKRGFSVMYRLKDVLDYIEDAQTFGNTAEASVVRRASV
ncbi:MAG: hypothetical protein ACQEXG_15940 [Pseudomonadota bacterium]